MDEAFLQFSQMIQRLLSIRGEFVDIDAGVRSYIQRAEIDMPVELDVSRDETGALSLGSVPPLYYADTSFRPSYHRLRLIVSAETDGDGA